MAAKLNERIVIIGAVMVIVTSIVSTVAFSRYLFSGEHEGAGDEAVRNVTFTDAVLTCQNETRAKLSTDLINMTVDDHSSRYENKPNLYKIFLNAQVQNRRSENGMATMAVYCFVRADQGRVAHFEQVEHKEEGEESAMKGEGGLFGWPM